MSKNQEIAETILQQLGGSRRLVMMVGAYNFVVVENGVAFKIKNAKANYIKIKLNSMDLYDLEVGRIRGTTYKVVTEKNDLYFDMLKPAIEEATGMYLSLYAKGGKMAKGGVVGNYELMPYSKGIGDTYNPKYQSREYFEGTKNDALDKANSMLSNEIGMVQVSIVNPKATNALNRTKKIATVVYKKGGLMANGGIVTGCNYSIGGL